MNLMTSSLVLSLLLLAQHSWAYDPAPRWGQAHMLLGDSLFIYGGKTDQFNSYSYTGAPSTNELLLLPLSAPFDASSPPWTLLASSLNDSTPQGPPVAWSTLSAINTSMGVLLGGIADPNSDISIQTRADSAILMNVYNRLEPHLTLHPSTPYTNEPTRRMQHATCSTSDGRVFIIGGVRPDGSGNAFSQHYIFNDNPAPTFILLESETGPPDIFGHTCIILPNGYLLVFGGLSPSSGGLVSFDIVWALDTSQTDHKAVWFVLSVDTQNLPTPRRGFTAVLLRDGRILIHGGQDAQGQTVYSDGWILDLNGPDGHAVWSVVDVLSQLGPRRDHFAVVSGDEVIIGFGYTSSAPAPAALEIYNAVSSIFVSSHTPPTTVPTPTIPGASQTPTATLSSTSRPGGGHTGSGGLPISGTATGAHPTHTLGGGDGDDGHGSGGTIGDDKGSGNSNTSAIAIGATLGAVALFLVAGGVIWYYRRRSRQDWERAQFSPLGGSEDSETSPDSGGDRHDTLGPALVGAAAVGTAASLPNEKPELNTRQQGGTPGSPDMGLPNVDINELWNLPRLRATIYDNISNASFATPLVPPSPTSSHFNTSLPQGSSGVAGAVGRGVGVVTGAVSAGVAMLAGILGVSMASSHRRVNDRPLPSQVKTSHERRDMLADEDTREFAYTGFPGHSRWRSTGGSSSGKGAWRNYEQRRVDGSAGSTWSLMSIFGAGGAGTGGVRGLFTREHSGTSRVSNHSRAETPWGMHWNEKGASFDGDWRSGTDEEGYVSVNRTGSSGRRPTMAREYSNVSTRSSLRYVDPFADPIEEEMRGNLELNAVGAMGGAAAGAYVASRKDESQGDSSSLDNTGPPSLPPIRTVLPSSQLQPQPLSPLSEQPSQPSLQSQSLYQLDLTQSQGYSQSSHATQNFARSRAGSTGSSYENSQAPSPFERPSSSHTSFGLHAQALQSYTSPSDTPLALHQPTSISYFPARPSSILDPPSLIQGDSSGNPAAPTTLLSSAPAQPMRRSDTWWARFARTRFLDRSSSDASRWGASGGMIDIRDPNPPPRLNPIEENQHSGSASGSGGVGGSADGKPKPKLEPDVALTGLGVGRTMSHGKSTTSLQTTRTVDSDALERLGGTMDVVQRLRDASGSVDGSHQAYRLSRADTVSTDESGYEADVAALAGMFRTQSPSYLSDDDALSLTASPTKTPNSSTRPVPSPSVHNPSPVTPHSSSTASKPLTPHPPSSGRVAARVAAYERRMSQDLVSPVSKSPGDNEDRRHSQRVDYGLVPRPNLFVANPDLRRESSNDS